MTLKAESEKLSKEDKGKLPETPKTAQDIWQQSVIGDYLARFKVWNHNCKKFSGNSLGLCNFFFF